MQSTCDSCGKKQVRTLMVKDGTKEITALEDGLTYLVPRLLCFSCVINKGVYNAETTIQSSQNGGLYPLRKEGN